MSTHHTSKKLEKRLIIVSNRLPFQAEEKENQWSFRQSSGGLVSAIKSYFESSHDAYSDRIWIGTPDFSRDKWDAFLASQTITDFEPVPVFVEDVLYNDFYAGFSNSVIWPLFHYFPSFVDFKQNHYEAYKEVNELFAECIAAHCDENDTVWIHDYHLFLLPELLRKKKPKITIGFFLHIPFPTFEIFREIPRKWKKEILAGLLGADLVGFHTIEYSRYFLEALQMELNVDNDFGTVYYGNRAIKTDVFPIGIDNQKFKNAVDNPQVIQLKKEIRVSFPTQKIMFSLDRLDYTKGVLQRLKAYELFLSQNQGWHGKVVMILNVIPSRDQMAKYTERKLLIEQSLSNINGKFSTYDWQPIIYFYQHLDFENLAALYQEADIGLVTPLRDGMNLVAKEYVASKTAQEGVLILSELAGAANELSEALLVNPFDEEEMSAAILQALTMGVAEQKNKMVLMQKRLEEYDVMRWVDDFLAELYKVKLIQQKRKIILLDKTTCNKIIKKIKAANKRLYFFDYDGTLVPFANFPSQAIPNKEVVTILKDISARKENQVVIISGRDSKTLDSWLGNLNVAIVAEHGALIRYSGEDWQVLTEPEKDWKKNVLPVMQLFAERFNGSFVEEKDFSIAWHYRNVQKRLGFSRSRELLNNLSHIVANTSLRVIDGNKVVEVRSAFTNKGIVAKKIMQEQSPDFILCMGDDKTDEDMFEAMLPYAETIKIGEGGTAAAYSIPKQEEVLSFLNILNSETCK